MKLFRYQFIVVGLLIGTFLSCATMKVSKEDAAEIAARESAAVFEKMTSDAQAVWNDQEILFQEYTVPLAWHTYGEKPQDGRSLFISLHGGGNAPPAVNDRQWQNQTKLYKPEEGVYLAPRAPTNTWNLWHEEHIDNVLDSIIRYAMIMEDVNPNKIYLLGYSAGGDGVFQLATRMADRWAAASMMAGHPGDANASNLLNLPFAIYMGGQDRAYNRNELAATWRKKLDSLKEQHPNGFVNDVNIYPDLPHWMNRKDTVAVDWMAGYLRDPNPQEVIWVQDDRVQDRFYWLQVPDAKANKDDKANVVINGKEITIHANTFEELYINLNDKLIDLDEPVIVKQNGKTLFKKKIKRNPYVIRITAEKYKDPEMIYSARLVVKGEDVEVFK